MILWHGIFWIPIFHWIKCLNAFRHGLPFFCCFCQRGRWKGCIVYESRVGHHGAEMMNQGLQILFGFPWSVPAALCFMCQRLSDSTWCWSMVAGVCVWHWNSREENDGNCETWVDASEMQGWKEEEQKREWKQKRRAHMNVGKNIDISELSWIGIHL